MQNTMIYKAAGIFFVSCVSTLGYSQESPSKSAIDPSVLHSISAFQSSLGQALEFNIYDDGEYLERVTRVTVEDDQGYLFTSDQVGNWVQYSLDDKKGILIHSMRSAEHTSTIVFPTPWIMLPPELKKGESYTSDIDFQLYYQDDKPKDGSLKWEIKYSGMDSIQTDFQTFNNAQRVDSKVSIDFPYKFGLKFDQTHYFEPKHGEIYRRIEGTATWAGIKIKSREFIENLSGFRDAPEAQKEAYAKIVENNQEGVTIPVNLKEQKS